MSAPPMTTAPRSRRAKTARRGADAPILQDTCGPMEKPPRRNISTLCNISNFLLDFHPAKTVTDVEPGIVKYAICNEKSQEIEVSLLYSRMPRNPPAFERRGRSR
jgi:hypothetical protein